MNFAIIICSVLFWLKSRVDIRVTYLQGEEVFVHRDGIGCHTLIKIGPETVGDNSGDTGQSVKSSCFAIIAGPIGRVLILYPF